MKRKPVGSSCPETTRHQIAAASVWQAPPQLILSAALERLLSMEEGVRWVRMASHVCSFWRATAQAVLLADTAISRPPLDDFRAIGAQQPSVPAKVAAANTVTTQAAMVVEATASTGMEACSKPRLDAGGLDAAVVGGTSRRHTARCTRLAAAARNQQQSQRAWQQASPAADAAAHAPAAASPAPQQGVSPPAAASPAPQQGVSPPAAASPNVQQATAATEPQGSFQSGMAAGGAAGGLVPDSDSEGSTHAQLGGRGAQRHRSTRRARSGARAGSVGTKPRRQRRQAQQQQPQQLQRAQQQEEVEQHARGIDNAGTLDAAEAEVPRLRTKRAASTTTVSARTGKRRQLTRPDSHAQPAADQAQQKQEQKPQPGGEEQGRLALEARGHEGTCGARGLFSTGGGIEVEQRHSPKPGSTPPPLLALQGEARAQQREGANGAMHGIVEYVKRMVGL